MTGLQLLNFRIDRAGQPLVAINTRIAPGQVLTIMGPSGSGKSTLISALIGTLLPGFSYSGQIVLEGQDITRLPPQSRRIGILFQDDVLFPHLSVGGNLAFGLPASLRPRAARQARIAAALTEMGLEGFASRDPASLSGGQRARVALLRTLLAQPRALLLDEPFARLDADLRAQVRALVFARARAQGLPVILVTHDPDDARAAQGPVLSPLGVAIALPQAAAAAAAAAGIGGNADTAPLAG